MNFINPILLLFAAAASIPLLLHLFNRQRVKIVEFSSIKYLRILQKTRMRKLKIRQILLLILRTLILLSVALAFARPTVEGGYFQALGGKSTTTAVLLWDISASATLETNQGSLFERGQEKALAILDSFTHKEKAVVLAFGSDVIYSSGEPSSDFDRLKVLVERIKPSSARANPSIAFRHAFDILSSCSDPNLEIYLISDLQGEVWRNFEFDLFAREHLEVKLFAAAIQAPAAENVAVTTIRFPNQIITAGREFSLQAEINNHKAELSADLLVALELNGKKVAQTNLSLPPAGLGKASFTQAAARSGFLWGLVNIDDDDLLGDNNYYFGMRIPSLSSIALIAEADRQAFHLQRALAPLSSSDFFRQVDRIAPEQAALVNLFDYDVVIINVKGSIPTTLLSSLRTYIDAGGGVLFLADAEVDLKSYSNKVTSPYFGIKLLKEPSQPQRQQGKYLLNKFDLDHPIFSPYSEFTKEELPQVEFFSHFQLLESATANVLARFSDNTPAVAEGKSGRGKALLYTFSFAEEYSDIIHHPLMVIMLNRSVEYLVSEPLSQREQLFAGEEVTRVVTALSQKQFALIDPRGDTLQLSPSLRSGDVLFNLGRLADPGIYRISGDGAVVDLFAVNFPPEESVLDYLAAADLAEQIAGTRLIILEENADPALVIAGARFGKELWKLFLLAAFVFLLLEMAVAAGGKRGEAGQS